jgi:outer membrane protein TolC
MNRPLACLLIALASMSASARDLVGVYEDALRSDPQIRQADANRLASREARPQAWSALLPQISGTLARSQDKQDGSETEGLIGTGTGISDRAGPIRRWRQRQRSLPAERDLRDLEPEPAPERILVVELAVGEAS